jgi:hypothetical protein
MPRLAGILLPSNFLFQKNALFAFGFIDNVKVSTHNADKEYVSSCRGEGEYDPWNNGRELDNTGDIWKHGILKQSRNLSGG